ncbi:MAG TPA: LptA/OstA family protein [Bryobacteraceae bacterium]|jgi:lipopolysaccharide export system protein LptA|nr:LptA/OstA family protein [Bryobacteraceae bacterium]
MRRYSILLAAALILILVAVGYTLKLRIDKARAAHVAPTPPIKTVDEGIAPSGWQWTKDDPQTGKRIVRVDARSFEGTKDPSTFELTGVALRLYEKTGNSYTYVKTERARFDEGSGILKSEAPVYIVRDVPADKDAEDKAVAEKHVRVSTTGVTYETKTGKAWTNDPAAFIFPEGNGSAQGVAYDPNTKDLELKSKVALNWLGKGPTDRAMHIETEHLVYKEAEHKIYLTPWSRMKRQTTTIEAKDTVVTLLDGRLHQIDGDHGNGTDVREDQNRTTHYSADKMTALFDEDGNLVQIIGTDHARVQSHQPASDTTLTGSKADLRFALEQKPSAEEGTMESQLHLVMADGSAVAESQPLPQPGVQIAETRILRSEHIELEMKPGGKDVQEIRTSSQAQLEFKPNRPEQSHRMVDASHLRVIYGAGSYIDTFLAWNVKTHTDKSAATAKPKTGPDGKPVPPAPALTWSDTMITKFAPNSNQVATIDQSGNFRYEEGTRRAWAEDAFLEQSINRITLNRKARVLDDTGSANADKIVMNQTTGDMDAIGHVLSTHEPDRNEKPGTSMLDATQPMQAQSDQMQTRDSNYRVFYEGHVVMWQGANRISADQIAIDRDKQSLDAYGNVVSELVDNKETDGKDSTVGASAGPVYTTVRAPRLTYRDDTRIATYSEGVRLTRAKMTITAKQVEAFLTPKSEQTKGESSLNHAVATGSVVISDIISPGRTRTGTGEHCEYYTKEDKVVLSGGQPQMIDSYKGVVKGRQLTYYSGEDHLIVDGKKEQLAFTRMKKK